MRASRDALLVIASIAVYVLGRASDATRQWRPIAASLLLLGALQFQSFYRDYLTDYPIRAAGWLMNNRRGALEEIFKREDPQRPVKVFVSTNILYADSYWRLYAPMLGRGDLLTVMGYFDPGVTRIDDLPDGALVLATTTAAADAAFAAQPQLIRLSVIPERDGSPVFVLLQKRGNAS